MRTTKKFGDYVKQIVGMGSMKTRFRHYLTVMLISVLGLSISNHQNVIFADNLSRTKPPSPCILKLGVSDWFPYQSLSDNGIPSGIQIKLVKQIFENAGCKLKFESMTFPEGLSELQSGSTDLLMNATPSAERKEYAHFSVAYRKEFLLLYSTDEYLDRCQELTLSELLNDGFILGLQKKLVYGEELSKLQKDPGLNRNIRYIDNNVQHLRLVIDNALDGIVDDPVVVAYRSTVNVTGDALSSCPIVVSSSPISLMFSKKTVPLEIVSRIDQAIVKIKKSEKYKENWVW